MQRTSASSSARPARRYHPSTPPEVVALRCTERLSTDPADTAALLHRGLTRVQLGEHRAAVADLTAFLAASAKSDRIDGVARGCAEALYYRGCCRQHLTGGDEAAVADFSEALGLQPDFKRAAYARAACLNRMGDFAGAIRDYELALLSDAASDGGGGTAHRGPSRGSPQAPAASYLEQRPVRSCFARARQLGASGPPEYVAALQERRRQQAFRRLRGGILVTTSENSLDGESLEDELTQTSASPSELSNGGVGGMNAFDPAALTESHPPSSVPSSDDGTDSDADSGGRRSPAHYVQRGTHLRRRGEVAGAIDMYAKALEGDPRDFRALFNRAWCADKLGRLPQAIDDYARAALVEPSNPYTHYNLGISCDRIGDLARAVGAFTSAIERHTGPPNPDFFHNRGLSLRKMGDYRGAIEDYSAAIAVSPGHFKALFNRGYCYERVGDYAKAVKDFTLALGQEPMSVNALHNRGVSLEKLRQLPEALADFDAALAIDPTSAYTWNARGLVRDQLRKHTAAIEDFTAAVHLQPASATFRLNRGHAHRSLGALEAAVADYTAAIDRDPGGGTALTALGSRASAHRRLGDYEAAVLNYSAALTAHGPRLGAEAYGTEAVKLLNNRAYCLARLERFPDAIQDYTSVLALDRANMHALHNRAISFEKCGNSYASIEDLTRVIDLCGGGGLDGAEKTRATASSAYYSRGSAWAALGRHSQAARDFTSAIDLDLVPATTLQDSAAREAAQEAHPAWQALQRLREQLP